MPSFFLQYSHTSFALTEMDAKKGPGPFFYIRCISAWGRSRLFGEVSPWGTSPLFNLIGFLGLAALGED